MVGDKGDAVDDLTWYEHLGLDFCFVSLGLCCCLVSSFLLRVMVTVDEGVRAMMVCVCECVCVCVSGRQRTDVRVHACVCVCEGDG